MILIETLVFTHQITEMVTDEQYAEFQRLLADSPEAGDVIKGSGGLRKIRLALDNRGKSGVASDLTAEQKAVLKQIIAKWS